MTDTLHRVFLVVFLRSSFLSEALGELKLMMDNLMVQLQLKTEASS